MSKFVAAYIVALLCLILFHVAHHNPTDIEASIAFVISICLGWFSGKCQSDFNKGKE